MIKLETVDLDPLDVMVVTDAGAMPEAAGRAFERLEHALPSLKGRKFYGYWDPAAKSYFACVVSIEGEDAAAVGARRGTIPGGRYRRTRLKGEPPELYGRIGKTFDEMAAAIGDVDRDRPWLEFYRARDTIDLFVPVR